MSTKGSWEHIIESITTIRTLVRAQGLNLRPREGHKIGDKASLEIIDIGVRTKIQALLDDAKAKLERLHEDIKEPSFV